MKLINFTFSVFIMFGVFMGKGFSQYDDDANKDRIPYNLLQQSQIMTPKPAFMIVTNSAGFENFFLESILPNRIFPLIRKIPCGISLRLTRTQHITR